MTPPLSREFSLGGGGLASRLLCVCDKRMKCNCKLLSKGKSAALSVVKKRRALRVGFLPEADCAPVIVAQEFGLFDRYGLTVELRSEASWRSIHNQFHQGLLDAAHAPATLPFLMTLGLTPEKRACVAGMVLSLQGNAITVSRALSRLGVRDAETMGAHVRQDRSLSNYTFGVAYPLSPQYFLLCRWLKAANIPTHAVRIESSPTEQMFPLLKLGYLDGYCAGEPWITIAAEAGVGECVATSSQMAPLHPEKVLMVRADFAAERADEHERLIAALIEACYLCDQPENRPLLCRLLAQPRYVNAPADCLEPGLVGPFGPTESQIHALHGLNVFSRARANEPSAVKSAWLTGGLYEFLRWTSRPAGLKGVFRPDIYRRALRLVPREITVWPKAEKLESQQSGRFSGRPLATCA
jgi:ABC-type nitrate/sulfonate/bicarbonate transport system substrate-binding protein